ncbi:hypothetical protein GRAN_4054 [Granulicella sibirica]|uniref:Uncharacterized protein n=1 Tax=Granulicella sibirica TaxID=2479048 RepID=A0A4Q0SY84_9BACT|nr:hypothetical protein GRAN_4054 [Granulicella sibirica]
MRILFGYCKKEAHSEEWARRLLPLVANSVAEGSGLREAAATTERRV